MTPVLDLPIAQLATTLAPLRGRRTDLTSARAPLPLRVAPTAAGMYEVIDGFKRLAQWTRGGATQVPVVVEDAAGAVAKARLLEANAPRRTLSPMDEARVVRSLADEDHLTPPQIVKLLGRGRAWVDRRLTLGRRLAPDVAAHVDTGRLSATTDTALARLPRGDQKRLAEAVTRHGLRTREAEALLAAWHATADTPTREALLRDPHRATPAPPAPSASPLGPTARELQGRFDQTERALDELVPLGMSALVPGAACIQHFILRLVLWGQGFAPWHYARFLDYATERMFLQRIGGRYRFIHNLLRDHFGRHGAEPALTDVEGICAGVTEAQARRGACRCARSWRTCLGRNV
jgi:ParB-like chromosome segregation protein Spo0J